MTSYNLGRHEKEQIQELQRLASDPAFLASVDAAVTQQRRIDGQVAAAVGSLRRGWANLTQRLATVDWQKVARLFAEYVELMPDNMSTSLVLNAALRDPATMPVPLAWVVPIDVAIEIVHDCATTDQMVACALDHQDEILTQCDAVLSDMDIQAATATREAVAALRDGHTSAAQSLAGNIIDSVILEVIPQEGGQRPRQVAIRRGTTNAGEGDELSVRMVTDRIVLAPVVGAYAKWYPGGNDPLPNLFARHATAHAAHVSEVFSPGNALIGVMLASSLVRYFRIALGWTPVPRAPSPT